MSEPHRAAFLAKRAFRRLGLQVKRLDVTNSAAARRAAVIETHAIDLVIDVGANEGQYAQMLREHGYRGRLVSFEPLDAAFEKLGRAVSRDPRWECWQLALGDRDGVGTLKIAAHSQTSSLFDVTDEVVAVAPGAAPAGMQQVDIARLDTIWDKTIGTSRAALLKVDVQGYEREVLRGAEGSLGSVVALEIELGLAEMYKGQALLEEMIGYVSGLGFQLFGIDPVFADPLSGRLMAVDGLFVRA